MVKAFFSRAKLLNSFEIYLLLGILFHSLTPNLSMAFPCIAALPAFDMACSALPNGPFGSAERPVSETYLRLCCKSLSASALQKLSRLRLVAVVLPGGLSLCNPVAVGAYGAGWMPLRWLQGWLQCLFAAGAVWRTMQWSGPPLP